MSRDGVAARSSGLKPFACSVVASLFRRRHESDLMRGLARTTIKDAQAILRFDGRKQRG